MNFNKLKKNDFIFLVITVVLVFFIILFYYGSLGKFKNFGSFKSENDNEKRNLEEEITFINNRLNKLQRHIVKKSELKIKLDYYVNLTFTIIKWLISLILLAVQGIMLYNFNNSDWHNALGKLMNINEAFILIMVTGSLIIYGKPITILKVFSLFHTKIKYLIISKYERHLDSINYFKEEFVNLEAKKKEKIEKLTSLNQTEINNTEQEKINNL